MRVYLPMKRGELADFMQSGNFSVSALIAPTPRVAQEYGVTELEELEYAALEIARTKSEHEGLEIIAAFELVQHSLSDASEVDAGVLHDTFTLKWSELIALYRITSPDEELEWYDTSEATTVLNLGSN